MNTLLEKKTSLPFGLWVILFFAGIQGVVLAFQFLVSLSQFSLLNIIFIGVYFWILWSGVKLVWRRNGAGIERLFLLYTLNVINIAFDFIGGISLSRDWALLVLLALNGVVLFHLNFLRVFFLDLKFTPSERRRDIWSGVGLILIALVLPTILLTQELPFISGVIERVSACSPYAGLGKDVCVGVAVFDGENITIETCTSAPQTLKRDCFLTLAKQSGNSSLCAGVEQESLCRALALKNESLCGILSDDVKAYCVGTVVKTTS